ncbi:cytochrome b/b6 domain-containing protein [Pseudooceanicola sp.]|uniref:cytochrome b n=1 Tax=Pseudooceanicola sp. TaxID=1914328 RepID=UPI00261A8ACA|nr:cytochrome b/b6 domain-containing protein [Pseudooceanicola sp.]MDF1854520.1 cytochrome b/b6 domain-containing protein [Pseudooceanicola sp.]
MPTHYSRLQIILHWLVAGLILLQFLANDWIGAAWHVFQDTGVKTQTFGALLHIIPGIAVLLFAIWRIALRLIRGVPPLPAGGNPLMNKVANWTHLALYVLIVLTPLSGMAAWGGEIKIAAEVHDLLTSLILILIGLHTVAALFHQFVLKDGLMDRMRRSR